MKPRPTNSLAEQELDKAEKQFEAFEENVKSLTQDRMNETPKAEMEAQKPMAQKEIEKSKQVYLKPVRTIGNNQKFNEKYRKDYEEAKEYVSFMAENHEIIGETIEIWTRPFGGMPAEEWKVPVNKPIWGPRYLAEQIKRKFYHRLVMQSNVVENNSVGQVFGNMVVDTTIPRLDALPVSQRKSIFMGASGF
jgi:hypothetical protein